MTPTRIETLLQASKFQVERWHFADTPVGPFSREIVVHPGAVVVLPMLSDREVVMIRNARPAVGEELLELPAGTLEVGEDVAACAARELEEETGYRPGSLEPLCQFYTTPGICSERMHAFVASELVRTRQQLDATEQIRSEIVAWEQALQYVAAGEIVDGKTIATLLTFALQRRK